MAKKYCKYCKGAFRGDWFFGYPTEDKKYCSLACRTEHAKEIRSNPNAQNAEPDNEELGGCGCLMAIISVLFALAYFLAK